ncbi:uncharacterized protein LOC123308105 [Coccinella septempunctata]|uniref:uncharacterized protein LOC123308105 n=1 Tax=Coccinella septempunctata TaxID=41139 RepID=UPI001D069999|nr:uncharacterized protein LOC123308105 [Coccinella septempunctata]XP_044746588.1 uncharacterized protein LOC123308105 [Coccinella septempunctata]
MSLTRSARMTKKQKQLLISYLEVNKEMLKFKHPIIELPTIKKKWEELALMLNNEPGANKTVKQWKEALNELKTNVRRKSRALVYEKTGTGGGPKKLKELDELEERLLALLSKVVILGAPNVVEAGLQDDAVPSAALENNNYYYALDATTGAENEQILFEYVPSTSQQSNEENVNANESETFTVQETSHVEEKKSKDTHFVRSTKRTRNSSRADPLKDLTSLHVECLKELAQSNNNMAAAISQLAKQFSKRNGYRSPLNNLRF